MLFKKKKVLILGGSSDIGRTLVNILSQNNNYELFIHHSKSIQLKNKKCKYIKYDFLEYKNKFPKTVLKSFSNNFDVIINLVGYIDQKGFFTTNVQQTLSSIKVNCLVPNEIIRMNIKHMIKKNYGRIINISSIGVKFGGGKKTYNYSISKHCLEFISKEIRDLASKNILTNNLRVGVTKTKLHKKIKNNIDLKKRIKLIPIKRMISTQEVAEFIKILVEDNVVIANEIIALSGGE